MKTAINLRTREFVIAREFYWPRLLITIAIILLIALFLSGSVSIYLYQAHLVVELERLVQDKNVLQSQVAPLEELEARISDLEDRKSLISDLESKLNHWSGPFGKVYEVASEYDFKLTSLSTASKGKLIIRGEGPTMRRIADFKQALVEEQIGEAAVHRHMTYGKQFSCEIELTLPSADGGEQ
ncbi:MAG TPA: hypothetical protein GX744_04475 [Firmicutes bacterium]|jgi:hypothetical protein|nr:hypothetical protein [Bacillota bacterium]